MRNAGEAKSKVKPDSFSASSIKPAGALAQQPTVKNCKARLVIHSILKKRVLHLVDFDNLVSGANKHLRWDEYLGTVEGAFNQLANLFLPHFEQRGPNLLQLMFGIF